MITRRGLIGMLLAAPVIIRTPGLLMPVKPWQSGTLWYGKSDEEILADIRSMLEAVWDVERAVFPPQYSLFDHTKYPLEGVTILPDGTPWGKVVFHG